MSTHPLSMGKKSARNRLTLHIRNMVCERCIRVVREELEAIGLVVREIKLGQAVVEPKSGPVSTETIQSVLESNGFGLLDNRQAKIVAKIKTAALNLVRSAYDGSDARRRKDSEYIAAEAGLNYSYLSKLFSAMEHITIEKYIILQRIEHVKELLKYDELSLKEIAYRMGYSSLAHLSSQFKKVTGMSASQYKKLKDPPRSPLDAI